METMAREYISRGDEVVIYTFSLQYPSLLFPGKSQTVDTPAPADLHIERIVNTCNPINWIVVGNRIRREAPDMVLMKYWTPFMAPCFGTIARIARRNGKTKVLCQIDNVEPHEHHIIDRPFNRYYLGAVDGFVYMSEQVHGELKEYTSAPALFSPHPMFENFGERVERSEACEKLGIDSRFRYLLFFGLIRDYKGLDLLLRAFADKRLREKNVKLIVAGEFYSNAEMYEQLEHELGLAPHIVWYKEFIPADQVRYFFAAADLVAQPYKSATQSGITQIAYHFERPMLVTNVGGLAEIVPHGKVGYVTEPNAEDIAEALVDFTTNKSESDYHEGILEEKSKYAWSNMTKALFTVADQTKK